MDQFYPIFEPTFVGNEEQYLMDCVKSGWISSQGEYVRTFEKKFAEYFGQSFGVATSNCTTALHLALLASGVGPGDEVICSNLTFIAPVNMIHVVGAKPVLVDCDNSSWAMDVDQVQKAITEKTKALIVVHAFGHSAPMDEIMDFARSKNLIVIEDVAEAPGGLYKGRKLGSIGDFACFSFFGNKVITSGEGGMLLTSSKEFKDKVEVLRDHGMSKEKKYHFTHVGFNYRMTNMQAAIGLAQFEKIESILQLRSKQENLYDSYFEGSECFDLRPSEDWCETVHWLYTLTLKKAGVRDSLISRARERGIELRPMIYPCHYAENFRDMYEGQLFPNAERIALNSFHLPSTTSLTENDIEFIAKNVNELAEEIL